MNKVNQVIVQTNLIVYTFLQKYIWGHKNSKRIDTKRYVFRKIIAIYILAKTREKMNLI